MRQSDLLDLFFDSLTPAHVLDRWAEEAKGNPEAQRRHHDVHMRRERQRALKLAETNPDRPWRFNHTDPFDGCWGCGRERAVCGQKLTFTVIEHAWAAARNAVQRDDTTRLVPYRCYWDDGLHWHLRRAKNATDRKRLRKHARKALRDG